MIVPSYPPDVNSVSCCGCHTTAVTSLVCPRKFSNSFMVRMSNTLIVWSLHPVASQLPLAFHLRHVTWFLCAWMSTAFLPSRASHRIVSESLPPDASRPLCGCQSTHLTSPPCPDSVCTGAALAKSNTRTVVSSEQLQNFKSVGANETPRTGSACALTDFRLFRLVCQYLMRPVSSPVSSQFSFLLQHAAWIAQSCACRIVSKLKLIPFQSVNSPFCEHDSSRRPSGMNVTTLTGVRILFVETCTNLVAKDVAGTCG
mmetsp:Transcript_4471/g.18348  ORF Transcript_4471/g.18348 Transcript_4471/m.18348 type:complete len:257 (-) Transcript_4471:226-996(-)